jgi:hypothetical protein
MTPRPQDDREFCQLALFYWVRIAGGEISVKDISEGSKRTAKQFGEWAELCFMARAEERGLNVSKPHGDSASYDVGVEQNGRFLRIVRSQHRRYGPGKLDFFAVYLIPIDLWYIIPFAVMDDVRTLSLTPRSDHKSGSIWKPGICSGDGRKECGVPGGRVRQNRFPNDDWAFGF